jgi:hypothetical protein
LLILTFVFINYDSEFYKRGSWKGFLATQSDCGTSYMHTQLLPRKEIRWRNNGRCSSWRDQFLLIQPVAPDIKNSTRLQEIKIVHERNGRVFPNIVHPNERTFSKLFDLADEDKINIIANGDIYFDEQSQLERIANIPYNVCYALSRWEPIGEGQLFNRNDSQDAWIFRGKPRVLLGYAKHDIGTPCCDMKLAWELDASGYTVLNPSKTIKTWHLHNSTFRTYHGTTCIPPPYLYLTPSELIDDKGRHAE